MVSESGSEDSRRGEVKNKLEETFARYESDDETSQLPRVEVEEAAPVTTERTSPEYRVTPTRIPGLDALIGGGLPGVSLLLIVGTIGSNYSTFINQVLHNHLSEGGKVAYYTSEASSLDVQESMESFGWNLREFMEGGQFIFVDVLTPNLQQLAELAPEGFKELRVNISSSLNSLKTDILGKIKENRWTVLHLSQILHNYDLREVMDLFLYWRAVIRVFGGLHFAVIPSGVHPETSLNTLKNLSDGVMEFRLEEGPRDFEGILVVRKLRGLRMARRVAYTVLEEGLSIETAERIR